MGFSALSLRRPIFDNFCPGAGAGFRKSKEVTGRGQRLGLSHNDVHLGNQDLFRAYHLHSQELSSGPCMHWTSAIVGTRTGKQMPEPVGLR